MLELWLQAGDDPTLGLPASLLWDRDGDVFGFLRSGDPRRDLIRHLAELEPVLADLGIEFDPAEPSEAELGPEQVRLFLREAMPTLEERDVPVLLPASWLRSPTRVRVNLTATSAPRARAERLPLPDRAGAVRLAPRRRRHRADRRGARRPRRREGALRPHRRPLARGPAVGRREGAALPRPPPCRSRDRRSRARGLGARDGRGRGRARRGHARRAALLTPPRRRTPLPRAADAGGDDASALPVPGARARLAAAARRPRCRRHPRRRHGPRQDRAGDRDARVRTRGRGRRDARADARRLPDERRQAVGRRDPPFRALAPRAPPPRPQPPRRTGARARRAGP